MRALKVILEVALGSALLLSLVGLWVHDMTMVLRSSQVGIVVGVLYFALIWHVGARKSAPVIDSEVAPTKFRVRAQDDSLEAEEMARTVRIQVWDRADFASIHLDADTAERFGRWLIEHAQLLRGPRAP